MDLGTRSRSTAALLCGLRAEVEGRQASLVRDWATIAEWAGDHVVTGPEGAATITEGYLDTGVPIAGAGAPLVGEFALMELVAVLGRSPDGGKAYVGRVIECAWRLPNVYDAVATGRLEPWGAERIADLTHPLSADAASFVDRQLWNASGVGWAQLERLITEAILRFDPEQAETDRQKAADHGHFDISEVDDHGLVHLDALMDAADGHDLDLAVGRRADVLGRLGDESSLDVRRSKAAAELARQDLALDLLIPDPRPGRSSPPSREWLRTRHTTIIVRPVIDLADHVPVTAYEIPDRHKTRVALRDHTCRFPHCTRPSNRCDIDHHRPHAEGGATCPCNLVPLCRRHHRAKTHSAWRYDIVIPGSYVWISPSGFRFRVDHRGTHPIHDTSDTSDTSPPDQ
ncbi:HNH endonuclease signature motif containing protein [Nocardioides nitrophenolicus]|uniref:HNH endonuclease signature motif containing protein n=1 Tax=Nocardioides nitrophenolicus TaxID=60489 RepID=UPI0019592CE0|nr:HNH endonuclease signature motif containing protein [Nocardioides nitrophenolicus]MBM7515751.1 hypothetical protein [Nocardioides nitrophenolicus]